MSFSVGAEQYDQFMGRYSAPLAPRFADFAGITAPQRVLDVGCGPGALTGELAQRLSPQAICAVNPSASFVSAIAERYTDRGHRSRHESQLSGARQGHLGELLRAAGPSAVRGVRVRLGSSRSGVTAHAVT